MTSLRGDRGTFKQVSLSTLSAADVGAVSLKNTASLIMTKEYRVENMRFICQKGHYIGGAVDFKTGIIMSLSLPVPTVAHILANEKQSTEERINSKKLILDLENLHRTKGQVMAMGMTRSMEDHQLNLVRQLVM